MIDLVSVLRQVDLRRRGRGLFHALDAALVGPTALAALQMRIIRRLGVEDLPWSREAMTRFGVRPAVRHYYDPFVDPAELRRPLDDARPLPGLDLGMNAVAERVAELSSFGVEALSAVPLRPGVPEYTASNGTFGGLDAAVLYAVIRRGRPSRLIEVGSGNSTLVASAALRRNRDEGHPCVHTSIEPFEMPWLEALGIEVVRERVETLGLERFAELSAGDVLFIDGSHVARPQGDVLFLLQEVLPTLAPGVIVHVHDIFTPHDYPSRWLFDRGLFWNEQYVLEALLTENPRFEVWFPCHHIFRTRPELFEQLRPGVSELRSMRPTSFWIRRR